MAINGTGISFSGLASGLDSGALIQKLVQLESLPIKILETKKEILKDKLSAVGTFKGLVKDLQTKAKGLSTKSDFLAFQASASLEGYVQVSASGNATEASHTITINKLAAVDRWAFNGVASVSASVLAVLIAMGAGFSYVLWLGAGSYLAAAALFPYIARVPGAGRGK